MLSAALSVVLTAGFVTPAAAATTDYPTWDQVEAAKGNEAATAATIAQIESLFAGLQAEAARLGDAAVARSAEAATAQASLAKATEVSTSLASQADAAADRARQSAEQAGQIAAALYRSGGTDLTGTLLMTSDEDSAGLLYRLGALGKIGGQLNLALEVAQTDQNLAESLAAQAEVARVERDALATEAQAALDQARAAEDAANAAVGTQQANLTLLYEQLASLKNTSVYLEQQYRIGQEAANAGGGSDDGGSGDGGGGGSSDGGFSVPGNEVNNVAAAQNFAMVQLASMGFGSDNGFCLIWLWSRESGWRTNAYNASSGAYGIPQSLPGSKMANYAADWRTNYETQIMWGLLYIQGRYGSPCAAWAHSESVGWY